MLDIFVLRNLLSPLWLLSIDDGLLYKDDLPIFTAGKVVERDKL